MMKCLRRDVGGVNVQGNGRMRETKLKPAKNIKKKGYVHNDLLQPFLYLFVYNHRQATVSNKLPEGTRTGRCPINKVMSTFTVNLPLMYSRLHPNHIINYKSFLGYSSLT